MAEEFQGGVSCWWNSPKNLFGSSPCSLGNNNVTSFDWPNHADMKTTRSSDNSAGAFSSSTSPVDWNYHQDILFHGSGKSEDNYSNIMLQDIAPLDSSMSFGGDSNSYINSFDQANGSYPLQPLTSSNISNSSSEFLRNSSLYNYNISSLLQTLFDTDSPDDQSLLDRNQPINHNYDDQMNISNQFLSSSTTNRLPFDNNNTPAAWSDIIGSSFDIPSIQSQFVTSSLTNKKRDRNEEAMVAKKVNSDQAAIKRARIETPSPLPTFKVRKEKLGDRVTALQQLVSPFGKTDTASVLHEAIEYIKFLHDQVSVLSTPYLKNRSPPLQHLQAGAKVKDPQGLTRDLKSRGLCLVPISSTFPVTAQTNADFWTPIFGESFKYA